MEETAHALIVVRVADIEASLAFYRALGLAFVQEQHGSGPIHYSCELRGLVLELYPHKASSPQDVSAHAIMLGFKVASLESTLANLHKLGIEPTSPPKESG